jgi:MipA family protein
MLHRRLFKTLILFSILSCGPAWAIDESEILTNTTGPLPLYELGLGVIEAHLPDYPGSNQTHFQTLPIPYFLYRGDIVRTDQNGGARAKFFDNEIYELNLSFTGGLPTNLIHNDARQGMPALDWTGELGPRFIVRLKKWDFGGTLRFGLPVRAMISTNFGDLRGHGFLLGPELKFEMPLGRSHLFSLFTTNFTDRQYSKFYYEVAPQFAQPGRIAYQASGGYFNSDLTLGIYIPLIPRRLQLLTFSTMTSYEGASNKSSPLLKASTTWSEIVAFVVTFDHSTANEAPIRHPAP